MAKKKRSKIRYRYRRHKKSHSTGGPLGQLMRYLAPIGYGFGRDYISDWVANTEIGKKLPATQVTDEATMIGLMWLAGKAGANKVPMLRTVLAHGKSIELGSIGRELRNMRQRKTVSAPGATGIYVYS